MSRETIASILKGIAPEPKKRLSLAFLSAPRMSGKEQAFFMQRLSFLIHSGMSILACLELLETQSKSKSLRAALASVRTGVSEGRTLSESIMLYPKLFNRFSAEVIATGEASGSLSTNLAYLANELKKRSQLRAKLIGALIYPALITVATISLTIALILFIFPKILPIFSGLGVELPWSTRAVLGVSEYLKEWGIATLIGAIAVGVLGYIAYRYSEPIQRKASALVLRLPLIGTMIQAYYLANITRTMSLLLRSGMTLRGALPATALATPHILYRSDITDLIQIVDEGGDLGSYLRRRDALFPDMVGQMVAVGESSGTLSETLGYISEYYEAELEELTRNLSTLVEPVLMILMGFIVGFVAVSMITPIYTITQHLHAK